MNNKKYDSKEREVVIAEMENLYNQLNKHVKYLSEANKTLKKIDNDVSKMESYYYSEWLDDYNLFKSDNSYMILMQDPIYNALQEIYIEKIKLLKRIVSKLQ